mmetsp:Transcript_20434/g.47295  ORF Transcript_20434/g.47295 Transcript_20434/m.47295 type:complete len:133 (+) Transcript_20434:587-985(+)
MLRNMVYNNKDKLRAGCIVAGWDPLHGAQVYKVAMGGSLFESPFTVAGSGGTYIYSLLDEKINFDRQGRGEYPKATSFTREEAEKMVEMALAHAMSRDGGSGGMIRTVTITPTQNEKKCIAGNQLPYGPAGW